MKHTGSTGAFARVQPALAFAVANLEGDLPLAMLSARAGLSPFQLHRMFSSLAGETPKQFTMRLRLSRGAALLLSGDTSVLDIALSCGFQSHEGFTRAFRRQFGMSPRTYRSRGITPGAGAAASHAAVVEQVAPCVRLFHMPANGHSARSQMSYSIVKKDLAAQPVLLVRRRVARSEIAGAIGGALPHIFQYAQQHGIALSGHPFTRYIDVGAGLLTIEPGMRVVSAGKAGAPRSDATGAGETTVIEDTLPAGPAATTVHAGSYETLAEAYAAVEAWMGSNGLKPAGAPWESYLNDPTEHPDPKDWKTEVAWPVQPA
jgi:AraC family transcriptional regulator